MNHWKIFRIAASVSAWLRRFFVSRFRHGGDEKPSNAPQAPKYQWVKSTVVTRAAGSRADPYYEWALATRFKHYGDAQWLPVLIELKEDTESFAKRVSDLRNRSWSAHIRVPRFYDKRPQRLKQPIRFIAALVDMQFLAEVYAGKSPAEFIKRFEIGHATRTLVSNAQPPSAPALPSIAGTPTVVTGVIDDGIAFAHERFCSGGTTRIEYFWDQLVPSSVMSGTWGYGRELAKRDSGTGIDARMKASTYSGLVDEDEVYRLSDFVNQAQPGHKPLAARVSHGAHVMDIACNDYLKGKPAPDVLPIVAVQLPVATVDDPSGATLAPQVFNGLCYILDRARAIATAANTNELPVVVNLSYGMIAGPHDGSSLLESAIDELIDSCDHTLRVVLPAGNNFLSRCHARFSIAPAASKEIAWRVLPDDWTESHLEIWLPHGTDTTKVAVKVAAPDGTASSLFLAGQKQELQSNGTVVGEASYFAPGEAGNRALLRLTLAPTGASDFLEPLAPAGLWRITVDNTSGTSRLRHIEAWIQRDDAAPGYRRRGRQSYLDDPEYRQYNDGGRAIDTDRPESYVRRKGTLNAIATGSKTIVIGGFRRSDSAPAPYTASGPLVQPGRGAPNPRGPEALFPSEDAPSLRGVFGAGTRSNSCTGMYGTSVSAPQATRWVAEQMVAKGQHDRNAVFNAAQSSTAPATPAQRPRFGGGLLDPATKATRQLRREL